VNKKLLDELRERKDEHIYVVLENDVETKVTSWLENVILVHKALPEIDFNEIDLKAEIFGRQFNSPILIEGMTGGTEIAAIINKNLATIAEEYNIPMGVGSQRVALKHPEVRWTFKIARETAPNAFLIGNIGAPQLRELTLKDLDEIVSLIEANALAIHLNALHEVIQLSGDPNYSGVLSKIVEIVDYFKIPIIVKETGAGISREVAESLIRAGVKAIDVAGVGGTSWSAVEYYRAKKRGDELKARLGKVYWDWGLPTAASIIEVKNAVTKVGKTDVYIIGSGGIRSGLDACKALVLGADFVGVARPFLAPALKGVRELKSFITAFLNELKTAMFLTGSKTVADLRNVDFVILPPLKDWIEQRQLKVR